MVVVLLINFFERNVMNWDMLLEMFAWLLGKLKDSDGDGRPDLLDSDPQNPEVK